MIFPLLLIGLSVVFFLALILFIRLGWHYGRRVSPSSDFMEGLRGTEAALFGTLGLLLAFTFYGAASRFDERRHLVVEESNAMGTAYLRVDLLPPSAQVEVKELFKLYVDQRLATYENWIKPTERTKQSNLSQDTQAKLWARATAAAQKAAPQAGILLLPALNQMFDIANTRMMYLKIHPPKIIYALLAIIALLCATVAGHSMAKHPALDWLHVIGFSLMLALIFYVVIDIEYPRAGFIRIDDIDQTITDLRRSMN